MILDDKCQTKPHIEYPCEWGYKIIGTNKIELEASIFDVMGDREYKSRAGNSSSKGKFHSLNASCVVASQEERDTIFKAFQEHPAIKMVI
ncbi:Proposed lipoate regulatory protein YbeD [hydrothermal vent metagenome]|uniref:Proposed lipoate regulatory protein YbeD n=1 Tax=hydrothermal vent metagenome TaxID=652676 RepID=A0A1W1BL44_9ZZZZ